MPADPATAGISKAEVSATVQGNDRLCFRISACRLQIATPLLESECVLVQSS